MPDGYGMMTGWMGFGPGLGLLTWLALLIFLVLGSVYFWQKIKEGKS